MGIGLFILPRAWSLLKDTVEILMESAPKDVDVGALRRRLESITGVVDTHDLHVWTITSGMVALSGHVVVEDIERSVAVLTEARRVLREELGIEHATLQIEPPAFEERAEAVHS